MRMRQQINDPLSDRHERERLCGERLAGDFDADNHGRFLFDGRHGHFQALRRGTAESGLLLQFHPLAPAPGFLAEVADAQLHNLGELAILFDQHGRRMHG